MSDLYLVGYIAFLYLLGYTAIEEASMHQIVRLPSQLGAIIQSERLKQGMTQSELASLTGTQQKTISAIENGSEGTKLDTLLSVIASLGLDIQIVPREQGRKSIEDVF
jgi:HTH-type transcriptional regulator/antitoxin HipB